MVHLLGNLQRDLHVFVTLFTEMLHLLPQWTVYLANGFKLRNFSYKFPKKTDIIADIIDIKLVNVYIRYLSTNLLNLSV